MNRLEEVLLISLEDPDFRIKASEVENIEIEQIINLLDKVNDLRMIPSSKAEMKRMGSCMMYKAMIQPHYLLLLFSTDEKAMLETRNLQEIEETVKLLSSQLESMLQTPA